MSQKIIIENRSQYPLDEIVLRYGVADLYCLTPDGDGFTLRWPDGLHLTVVKNKRSVRVLAHQNDGVDHKEEG